MQKTEDIPHEVIETGNASPAIIPALEDEIKKDLAKFNVADSRIAELKETYGALTIEKDGFAKVKEGRSVVRNLRISVEKKRKELKEESLVRGRAIDGEAKRITNLLEHIESPLEAEIRREEEEKARVRLVAEEAAQLALNTRINDLLAAGLVFNGAYYTVGENIAVDVVSVKNMTDERFAELIRIAKEAKQKELDEAAAKLKAEKEEREALKRQQQEQAAKEKELQEREDRVKEIEEAQQKTITQQTSENMPSRFPNSLLNPSFNDENDLSVLETHYNEQKVERISQEHGYDKERVKHFLSRLKNLLDNETPKLEDSRLISAFGPFITSVSDAHRLLEQTINNL